MGTTNELYHAILARRSVRRYAAQTLSAETLAQVQAVLSRVVPLVSGNDFQVLERDVAEGEDLAQAMGGYGRFVSPPHYLVPYVIGENHPLVDLGYRVQQIAVRLAELGIGSCYIGSLDREDRVRERYLLPGDARIGAFLIYGYPATGMGGRSVNALIRRAVGATNKLAAERLFFAESFDHPISPPKELYPLVEAARHAASAHNAQPWRFLWRENALYLYVRRDDRVYGRGASAEYRFYDGGICMANVSLALEALAQAGQWQLLTGTQVRSTPDLQPLAKLVVP
jgi:nitroreductase